MTKINFIISIAALNFLLSGTNSVFAQCGLPGTPPCPKKTTPKNATPKPTVSNPTTKIQSRRANVKIEKSGVIFKEKRMHKP